MERASLTASISVSLGFLVFLGSVSAAAQPAPSPPPPPSGDCQASPDCAKDLAAGVSDYQQRRYDTALATFQKAFAQSNDARVLVLMGRTYFKRGDSPGALALYQRAQPQIVSPADRAKLEQYIAEARAPGDGDGNRVGAASAPDLALRPDSSLTATQTGLTSSPPPATEKKGKPWVWAVIGVTAAAVVGTAVGLGVYYGTAAPHPDQTVHFP